MSRIVNISARQILDSRGNPTIEVDVLTETGNLGRASVPSGVSKGKYEVAELRDNDEGRFLGKGVLKAVDNVNKLSEELNGFSVLQQSLIDASLIELDGTPDKSYLGANAILAVSLACAKAAADITGQPLYRYIGGVNANTLPIPMINILNGGLHADNKLDIQEFMIMPIGAEIFSEALRMGVEVFHNLKKILKEKNYSTNIGDEGGFAPDIKSNEEAIELILKAIEKSGFKPGEDLYIGLDVAASELYNKEENLYNFSSMNKKMTSDELINYYKKLTRKYPIISIEDGLDQDDWDGWRKFTKTLGADIQIVGDDLFATNVQRLIKGVNEEVANAIIIKLNQIGTLTETINAIEYAKRFGYNTIISHRSGETEDIAIADLAVALNTGLIKTGAPCRTDRVAKYNQLLRIEEGLGSLGRFWGKEFLF